MTRWVIVMAFLFSSCGASTTPPTAVAPATAAPTSELEGGAALFEEHGVDGAFLVRFADGREQGVGGAAIDRRYVPASTFKIPNTIIGVARGVIPDASFSLEWDGVERSIAAWNRDHDLRSAIRESVVWWYQELARRVGLEPMRAAVRAMEYGNAEIGDEVDRFWLEGPLAISAREQVGFLERLTRGQLGVDPRGVEVLRDVMPSEPHGDAGERVVRVKTGTHFGGADEPPHAWRVGWVEHDGEVLAWFALLVDGAPVEHLQEARGPLQDALLARAGLLPR